VGHVHYNEGGPNGLRRLVTGDQACHERNVWEHRAMADGPLSDLLVLDLTRALAGPHAAMMLGDLGARVIKVEPPAGDDTRSWGPPFVGPEEARESTYFLSANRNKESLVLDLKDPADGDVLARLVERADVLMENYRVGVLDRLGFPVSRLHELNPGLVDLSITGFGHDGPEATRAGYDQIAQGEGGLMSITGTAQPTKVGVPIADLIAGMNGAFGVVAALHERSRTGRGRVVRTSLLAGMIGVHAFQGTKWSVAGEVPGLSGDHHPSIAPYGMFATGSAPIQIACGSEGLWRALCSALGWDPAESGFATNPERVANRDGLIERLESLFAAEDAEHWLSLLASAGVPAGKVRSMDDVYSWDQTLSQGLLLSVDHSTLGSVNLPGSPIRFDDNAFSGGRPTHEAPPTLGQHNQSIREWLDS
jgi:crotonobetainyl-CoA:carnitine CoA-transferase CaiB-like acyl-CoA transferase